LYFAPVEQNPNGMIQIQGGEFEKSFNTAKPGGIHLRLDPECDDENGCKWNKA